MHIPPITFFAAGNPSGIFAERLCGALKQEIQPQGQSLATAGNPQSAAEQTFLAMDFHS
jgi:hypothetical protein